MSIGFESKQIQNGYWIAKNKLRTVADTCSPKYRSMQCQSVHHHLFKERQKKIRNLLYSDELFGDLSITKSLCRRPTSTHNLIYVRDAICRTYP